LPGLRWWCMPLVGAVGVILLCSHALGGGTANRIVRLVPVVEESVERDADPAPPGLASTDGGRRSLALPDSGSSDDAVDVFNLSWRKGAFRIVPYGIGWLNMAFDTARTANGAFALYVISPDQQGEPQFSVSARATRLGFNVTGPHLLNGESGGRIELDFHGFALTENKTGVLLRHAYGEFRAGPWRVLGGQTTDVISPLYPNVLNYTVQWAAGNIGYRRAQFRVEREFSMDSGGNLLAQASLNQTIVSDFVGAPDVRGEDAGWPTVMGRVAWSWSGPGPELVRTIGLSGHVAQLGTDFLSPPPEDDRRFLSWSFNVDVQWPLSDRCGFHGEFFMGQGLGTFLGGINQGVDPIEREAIRAMGGWAEFWYHWTAELHSHVGFGIDDPNDNDLSPGRRTQNHVFWANVVYNVSKVLEVGLETSWWETRYKGLRKGEAARIEFVMRYHF